MTETTFFVPDNLFTSKDVFPYRIGGCAQCDGELMIRDTKNKVIGIKSNYRLVCLEIEEKTKMIIPVCDVCVDNIDMSVLINKVFHVGSQAFQSDNQIDYLKGKQVTRAYVHKSGIQGRDIRDSKIIGVN